MATIDKLLIALADKEMDCLVLEPGRRPCLRKGDNDHEVTKTALDGSLIERLLAEVAPPGETPPADESGGRWEFDYGIDGRAFHFFGLRGPKGWLVSVTHDPSATPPPPRPSVQPAAEPFPAAAAAAPAPAPAAAPTPSLGPPAAATAAAPAATGAAPEPAPEPESGTSTNPAVSATTNGGAMAATASAATAAEAQDIGDIKLLLTEVIGRAASDLHVSSDQPPYVRVDGDLEALTTYAAPEAERLERLLYEIVPKRNREELEEHHQTDFGYELPGKGRFRVNVYRERRGIAAAFRLIPQRILSLDELGLPQVATDLTKLTKGLVLVTGATGSGKTTTLAAFVDAINRSRSEHVVTIEDPIEFVHPSRECLVHQRQIGLHSQSFASALRAALREDPDVVMVGELRDLDATSIALRTAETGHLVFGTLHTTSAAGTIERLVDQYPSDQQPQIRLMLATGLRAVISQTLLKRVGGGRIAAFEMLPVTGAVAALIRDNKTFQIPSVMQTGKKQGMTRLDDSLLRMVEAGLIYPEEAYRRASEKTEFASKLRGANVDTSFLEGGAYFFAED